MTPWLFQILEFCPATLVVQAGEEAPVAWELQDEGRGGDVFAADAVCSGMVRLPEGELLLTLQSSSGQWTTRWSPPASLQPQEDTWILRPHPDGSLRVGLAEGALRILHRQHVDPWGTAHRWAGAWPLIWLGIPLLLSLRRGA